MINDSVRVRLPEDFSNSLIRWRWVFALIGLLVGCLAVPTASKLDFDHRVESLFTEEDPDLMAYQKLQRIFGGKSVALLVYHDPDLSGQIGMERNRQITKVIGEVEGVKDVLSLSKLNDALDRFRPSFGVSEIPKLFREEDSIALGFVELFSNYTHSTDLHRASMVVLLESKHSDQSLVRLKEIRDALTEGSFPFQLGSKGARQEERGKCFNAVLVGESVMINDAFGLLRRDGRRLASLTILLLGCVLLLTLRDVRLVILATISVAWSVVVTRALLVILGWQLSIASSVLTALITVILVTSVLHLGVGYRRLLRKGRCRLEATVQAISGLAMPILWTGMTDAAGFLALSLSSLAPISQFGLMISISVTMGLAALCLFSPVLLVTSLPEKFHCLPASICLTKRGIHATWHGRWGLQRILRRASLCLVTSSMRRPWVLVCLLLLMSSLAVIGIPKLESERSFLNNFKKDSVIARSYQVVEEEFGGAGVWDVILDAPLDLTDEYLRDVLELEEELREIRVDGARLTKVLSIADADLVMRRSRFAALLPVGPRLSMMSVSLPSFFEALLSPPIQGKRYLRLMLRSAENLNPSQREGLIEGVRHAVDHYQTISLSNSETGASRSGEVTGYYLLLSRLIDQVLQEQWRCLLSSILMVGGLLSIFVRSIRLGLVSLVPNVMPMLTVLAVCGLLGERLNMGAAMIAAVSVGISIDGSVHLLFHYQKQKLKKGRRQRMAVQMAAARTGVPVLLATLALVIGFGVLSLSEFVPTATFGFLIAITMILGAVANLTFLPALLTLVEKDSASNQRPMTSS